MLDECIECTALTEGDCNECGHPLCDDCVDDSCEEHEIWRMCWRCSEQHRSMEHPDDD